MLNVVILFFLILVIINFFVVESDYGLQILVILSIFQQMLDFIYELLVKFVKEVFSGEFMEFFKLLFKNFNVIQFFYDEFFMLILENLVIKVNKVKVILIISIEEWILVFIFYMSVIISKYLNCVVELLEYFFLICYVVKYYWGLGWCVYDVKFC